MTEERTCGHCLFMDPSNGYCRKLGRYVNALDKCRGYAGEEERIAPMPKKPRKKRERPPELVFRTEKICASCGYLLPIQAFVRSSRKADGHDCYRRECFNAIKREQRRKRREQGQ